MPRKYSLSAARALRAMTRDEVAPETSAPTRTAGALAGPFLTKHKHAHDGHAGEGAGGLATRRPRTAGRKAG